MKVYTCEHEWEAMLTCIYEAFYGRSGHKNTRLMFEPISQYTLFDEYIHVEPDSKKADKVIESICTKISAQVYNELAFCAMAYEEDVLDTIYRVLILGFAYGPGVLNMLQYKDVMHLQQISIRLHNESHSFIEFIRFHEHRKGLFVAHIEPKSKLVVSLGNHFKDRMPSENWIIVDDVHKEALIHPKNEEYYYRQLSDEEFENLTLTEMSNDEYTDLWKVFFDSIAINERKNKRCQENFFPIWKRKHAVEFMN